VNHEVYVTFSRQGAESVQLRFDRPAWAGGEMVEFRDARFSYDPSRVQVEIRFPGETDGFAYPLADWTPQ
jgi:hypothetical protein